MRIYSLAVLTLKWVRMCPNCMLFTGCQSYLFFGRFCLLSLLVTWHTPLRGVVGPRLARQALFTWERANLIYTTYLLLKLVKKDWKRSQMAVRNRACRYFDWNEILFIIKQSVDSWNAKTCIPASNFQHICRHICLTKRLHRCWWRMLVTKCAL